MSPDRYSLKKLTRRLAKGCRVRSDVVSSGAWGVFYPPIQPKMQPHRPIGPQTAHGSSLRYVRWRNFRGPTQHNVIQHTRWSAPEAAILALWHVDHPPARSRGKRGTPTASPEMGLRIVRSKHPNPVCRESAFPPQGEVRPSQTHPVSVTGHQLDRIGVLDI